MFRVDVVSKSFQWATQRRRRLLGAAAACCSVGFLLVCHQRRARCIGDGFVYKARQTGAGSTCQPTESFEFETDIFVSAGIFNIITDYMENMKDLTLCRREVHRVVRLVFPDGHAVSVLAQVDF